MLTALPERARLKLDALLTAARENHTDQLAVSWRGEVAEWNFNGSSEPILTNSITKSVVGLVISRLVTLGKLSSVDESVSIFFPEWRQGRKRQITVRMLMNHTSGLQNVPTTNVEIYPSSDFVQLALCAELADALDEGP